MFAKKVVSFLVMSSMLYLVSGQVILSQIPDKEKSHSAKVEKLVRKMGAHEDSRVIVWLKNKKKIKGYIDEIGDDDFTVVDKKAVSTLINFSDVRKIKGKNIPAGVWITVGVGAGLGVFALALLYAISKN